MIKITNQTRSIVCSGALLLTTATACSGVDDVNATGRPGSAGMDGSGNEGNVSEGGRDDDPVEPGDGGGGGRNSAGTAGMAPLPTCKPGKRQCDGNQPQLCNDESEWENLEECSGATKVCTGEGVCSAYRLVNSGIDSFGMRPEETAGLILKEQTLAAAVRICGTKTPIICVTGGVR
jgi:hypothetical protein